MISVNLIAVLIAAVVAFVVGFLMHGPLFGKVWMRLADVHPTGNEKFSDMYGQMFLNLIANIVTAYVLAVVYAFATASSYVSAGAWGGVVCAFLVWLGFQLTGSSMEVIWMKRSVKLWLFDNLSAFLALAAMGAIIALM